MLLFSNFIKKYANLVLDSSGTLTPEIVTVCGGRRSVFSRIHMFGPYPDQTYPGSWIRYNFLTLIKSMYSIQQIFLSHTTVQYANNNIFYLILIKQ